MSLRHLVLRNILGSLFRSGAILLCAALVAGLGLASTLVVQGAEEGLRNNLSRMGADIVVIPWGTMSQDFSGAQLMGMITERWMPKAYMDRVALVPGVDVVSPQLYLSTLHDSPYSTMPEVYVVAYDPATDFTLKPWIVPRPPETLALGEAVVGALITPVEGNSLDVHDYPLRIVARLEPTEGDIDQTIFVSFETAQALFIHVQAQPEPAFEIQPESVSSVMVNVKMGADPHEVAIRILEQVPGVVPIESTGFFQSQRGQMVGLLRAVFGLLAITWVLSMFFVGLVFSLAANERRRQIGVLRALGATAAFVFRSLLAEGAALAVGGGAVGIGLAVLIIGLFGPQIATLANIHVHLPPGPVLLAMSAGGLVLALLTVTPAVWLPARRISAEEPSLAMRE
ncbi:MAG: ABC transporter permease [Anaerolineae bacterium]